MSGTIAHRMVLRNICKEVSELFYNKIHSKFGFGQRESSCDLNSVNCSFGSILER